MSSMVIAHPISSQNGNFLMIHAKSPIRENINFWSEDGGIS